MAAPLNAKSPAALRRQRIKRLNNQIEHQAKEVDKAARRLDELREERGRLLVPAEGAQS